MDDVEKHHGSSIYRLERITTRLSLDMGRLMRHFGLRPATEEDVDEVLDER